MAYRAMPSGADEARPRRAPPVAMVIFGASGDLTQRKLIPALFDIFVEGLLSPDFVILGFGRTALDDEQFREIAREGVQRFARHTPIPTRAWRTFRQTLHYQRGQF